MILARPGRVIVDEPFPGLVEILFGKFLRPRPSWHRRTVNAFKDDRIG